MNDEVAGVNKELLSILQELLDNSSSYRSAIELDFSFDGEEWDAKARALVEKSLIIQEAKADKEAARAKAN